MRGLIALFAALLFVLAPAAAQGLACDHANVMVAAADADPHAGHEGHGAGSHDAGAHDAGAMDPSGACPDGCAGGPGCSGCFAPGAVAFTPSKAVDRLSARAARSMAPADTPDGRMPLVDTPPPRA